MLAGSAAHRQPHIHQTLIQSTKPGKHALRDITYAFIITKPHLPAFMVFSALACSRPLPQHRSTPKNKLLPQSSIVARRQGNQSASPSAEKSSMARLAMHLRGTHDLQPDARSYTIGVALGPRG